MQFFAKSVVPLFVNFYGAKVLLPEEFGGLVYGLTFLSLINLMSNFGISSAVLKESAELNSKNDDVIIRRIFPSTAYMSLIISALIIFSVFLFVDNIPTYYYWSIPYLFLNPLTAILDGILVGAKNFKLLSITTVLSAILLIPTSIILIDSFKELGVILTYSIFYIVLFLLYYIMFPFKGIQFDKKLSKKIIKYAVVIGVGSVSFFLYTRVDIFILKEYDYLEAIGNYELIMRVFELTNIPIVLIAQVLAPDFVKLLVDKKITVISRRSKLLPLIIFLVGVILSIALYFILPRCIEIYYPKYFTPEFMEITTILLLTVPLKFVGIFMTLAILTPLGYAKTVSYTTLFFGLINVLLDFVFIKKYGFIGVFYATLIIHNINIIIQYLIFHFKFKKDLINDNF